MEAKIRVPMPYMTTHPPGVLGDRNPAARMAFSLIAEVGLLLVFVSRKNAQFSQLGCKMILLRLSNTAVRRAALAA